MFIEVVGVFCAFLRLGGKQCEAVRQRGQKKTTLAFWERTGQLIKRSFKENKSKPTLPNVCSRFLRAAAVYFARSRPSAPFGGRGCFRPLTVQRARTLRRLQANLRRPCVLGMLVTAHGAHFGAPGGLFSRPSSFSFCPSPAVVFFSGIDALAARKKVKPFKQDWARKIRPGVSTKLTRSAVARLFCGQNVANAAQRTEQK